MAAIDKLKSLEWQSDRLLVADVLFRLVLSSDERDPVWSSLSHFDLYKPRELVEEYANALETFGCESPRCILELGLYDCGSMVLWNEVFSPSKIVGVDILDRRDSEYFEQYKSSRHLEGKLKTYWGVDQKDREALLKIVGDNFEGGLDLIIDDASHFYEETKASFELLFPLLKPGGLYVIEDWQWAHWREFQTHEYFRGKAALTGFIAELIALTGSQAPFAPSQLNVYSRMAVVKGGIIAPPLDFAVPPL